MNNRRTPQRNWMLSGGGESYPRAFSWIYRNAHRVEGITYTPQQDGSADVTFFLDNNRTVFRGHYASVEVLRNWQSRSRTFRGVLFVEVSI